MKAARGTILLLLSFFAFIAWIIAMSTDIAWADSATTEGFGDEVQAETHMDTWFTCAQQDSEDGGNPLPICYRNNDDEIGCQAYKDRFRVVQSFLVLAGIFILALIICSALDRFALLSDVRHRFGPRTILVTLSVLVIVCTAISFSVAFSIPKTSLCGAPQFADQDGFSYGPSPFFTAIMCLCGIIALAVALVKEGWVHESHRHPVVAHDRHHDRVGQHDPAFNRDPVVHRA
jgi:hypothetical protein